MQTRKTRLGNLTRWLALAAGAAIATGADAQRILDGIQRASADWRTRVEIQGEIGIVRVAEHAP